MTGYERVKESEKYYHIIAIGGTYADFEGNDNFNNNLYAIANYYSDKTVAENNARAEILMRQLRRFAVEHNNQEIDWKNKRLGKYEICFDYDGNELFINDYSSIRMFGQIYFTSEEIAKQAIEEFKDDLLWYFTEYCDHVVEAETEECGCELCSNGNLANVGINDNRIALWGGNNKPEKEQKLKYCPNCGKKLEGE